MHKICIGERYFKFIVIVIAYYIKFVKKILLAKVSCVLGVPRPIKLSIPITFACNLKCKTCNIWNEYIVNPSRLNNELNKKEWFKFFDEIGKYLFWVDIGGGEFSLRSDIADIVLYIFKKTDVSLVGLVTNGVLKERIVDIINFTLDNIDTNKMLRISLSLDGEENIHDYIRNQRGVFASVIDLFYTLKKIENNHQNFRVNIVYTISDYNAGMLTEFWSYIKKIILISEEDITFNLQHHTYAFRTKKFHYYSQEFAKKINRDIETALSITRQKRKNLFHKIKPLMDSYYIKNIPKFIADPHTPIIPCVSAANYSAYIDPDGTIYPCAHWNYPLGNIKENFLTIWHSDKAKLARRIIRGGKCSNCWGTCEFPQNWLFGNGLIRGWW